MINSFIQKLSKILHIIMHFDRNGKRFEKHILIFFNYSKNKKKPSRKNIRSVPYDMKDREK